MKRILFLLTFLFSFSAVAQLSQLTVEQLQAQKEQAIEQRDFLLAEQLNTELLKRKSLTELTAHFEKLKNSAVAESDYQKANFYKERIDQIVALEALDLRIKAHVENEEYLEANALQQQYNTTKELVAVAKYGQPVPTPTSATNTAAQQRIQVFNTSPVTSAPAASSTTQSVSSSGVASRSANTVSRSAATKTTKTTQKPLYYVAGNTTAAVLDNMNFNEGEVQFAMENTHTFSAGKPNYFGDKSSASLNHGSIVSSISYGFSYFDFQNSDNLGTYGSGMWAKAGVGYSYNTDFGSAFFIVQSTVVNYIETTTAYLTFDGYYDWIDGSNTAWFPENAMSLKIGSVAHPSFLNRKSSTQWGISFLGEFPFVSGAEPTYSIGISTTLYKKR